MSCFRSYRSYFSLILISLLIVSPFSSFAQNQGASNVSEQKPAAQNSILVVGDSLSAEYGIQRGTGWVPLLEKKLVAKQFNYSISNQSISGDTSFGGKARFKTALDKTKPKIVILELGANDALRGLDLKQTKSNLAYMIDLALEQKAKVLLLGVQMPPNYGPQYAKQFAAIYPELAKEKKIAVVPFFLKGVADIADTTPYIQADRLHPNEKAQPIILNNIWPQLLPLLQKTKASSPSKKAS
jgi:acyl-CoA thioesterase-1